jgi:hypothetical protein
MMYKPCLARVSATLSLLGSRKKPMSLSVRTHEMMTTCFSCVCVCVCVCMCVCVLCECLCVCVCVCVLCVCVLCVCVSVRACVCEYEGRGEAQRVRTHMPRNSAQLWDITTENNYEWQRRQKV